ncbi:ABC transporter ATP-binding protein [Henriciella sp. AS95]|uniref:ABC transporter ATP-binding protein n=1 Tax=Henriciella sp. AS95 TaxID=3135782 RepID=UPI00317C0690
MISFDIAAPGIHLGNHPALNPCSAELKSGELVGIIGPNGAGKSTLIRLLAGLLPQSGEAIKLDGVSLSVLRQQTRAQRIAWLGQSRELSWDLTVEDVVSLGRHAWGGGRYGTLGDSDRNIVDDAIQRAGASHLVGRHVLSLSGGEQARVHLARLLSVGADHLLLDEPLASLDIAQQLSVLETLRAEASSGKLVCVAIHDLLLAKATFDRLIVLDAGTLVADGAPDDVLSDALLKDVFGVQASPIGQTLRPIGP